MLNYSLDVSTSSLIAICTISCLYKLFVQVDHDPTITSCLYERESVTYRLAHLHLNRKSNDDTTALYTRTTLSCDVLMKTKCSHAMFSWEQVVLTKCSYENIFVDFILMRVIVQNTRIKCLQMWEGLKTKYVQYSVNYEFINIRTCTNTVCSMYRTAKVFTPCFAGHK